MSGEAGRSSARVAPDHVNGLAVVGHDESSHLSPPESTFTPSFPGSVRNEANEWSGCSTRVTATRRFSAERSTDRASPAVTKISAHGSRDYSR
jgi:hypothetical protein